MSHKFRPGDRIRLLLNTGWRVPSGPRAGDIGTIVDVVRMRVVYDRPETHKVVDYYRPEDNCFNGKQSWATRESEYRYLGMRVNPDKV